MISAESRDFGGREVVPEIGLSPDYINVWERLGIIVKALINPASVKVLERIITRELSQDIPSYAEYLQRKYDEAVASRLLKASNPVTVAQLDELARLFNSQRLEILSLPADERNRRIEEFWSRAENLIPKPQKNEEEKN